MRNTNMMKRLLWLTLCIGVLFGVAPVWSEVTNSCVECHQKAEEKELSAPVQEWMKSIHYENGITCVDCHGGNARADDEDLAMDPDAGFVGAPEPEEVPDFCGKCHSAIRDNYMASAHASALLEDGSGPDCVTCHTAHSQQKASLELINEDLCGDCHDYDKPSRLKEAIRAMDDDINLMKRRVDNLFKEGLDVESESRALFAIRNRAHRLTHTLNIEKILRELGYIRTDLQFLDTRVKEAEDLVRKRKNTGTVIVVILLLSAFIAKLYYDDLKKNSYKDQIPTHLNERKEPPGD